MTNTVPVSYTHLDVYKRQMQMYTTVAENDVKFLYGAMPYNATVNRKNITFIFTQLFLYYFYIIINNKHFRARIYFYYILSITLFKYCEFK